MRMNQQTASQPMTKESRKSLGKLVAYCKDYKLSIIIAMVLAAASTIGTLVGPGRLAEITDIILATITTTIDLQSIYNIGIVLVVIYIASLLCGYFQGFIMANMTQKITKRLRRDISRKINNLPLKYFDGTSIGDTLSRITNDVDTIGQTLNQSLGMLFSAITLFIGSLVMMLVTNVYLTMTAVIATFTGFILMMLIMKNSQKHFRNLQSTLGKLNGHVEEMYAGHHVVKLYNAGDEAKATFQELNQTMYKSAWKSQFLSGLMMPIMMFVGNFGYVAVCVVGAVLAMKGQISFGVIVAFMVYVRMFSQPLSQLAQIATSMQSTSAASHRVFAFLDEKELEPETHKTQTLENIAGDVTFKNVHFGYDANRPIINDFTAQVKAGQKIAIVGPTGAGKTTIVNLLMRFYEIDRGDIAIDGVSIHSLTRENIHSLFCMVLQDTWIFEGSIKDNVVYAKQGVSDKEVIAACKAVGIHHFIKTLPKGYDTVLNDKTTLSAGQKQLITIARAMIENAPMLILDEATSSVDTRTEVQIQIAMDKLMHGRTSFVIAHRLSTIKNADVIFVMKDGDIIESGNHVDLLSQKGFYADLYQSQFEKGEEIDT